MIELKKKMEKINKRPVLWLIVLAFLFATAATVYAVYPAISLDSPTSFPVDI